MTQPSKRKKKLVIVVNSLAVFHSHRLPIALAALEQGYHVIVVYGDTGRIPESAFDHLGLELVCVSINRRSTNPFTELKSIIRLRAFFWAAKPDIVHLVTFKPMIYGGLAAFLAGVPSVVFAVTGMGSVFLNEKSRASVLKVIIRNLFRFVTQINNHIIIVQNRDDLGDLVSWKAAKHENIRLIPGAGVNLDTFSQTRQPDGLPTVTFLARFLRDKGILEFVSAVRILRSRGVVAKFWLVGGIDPSNPSSLSDAEIEAITQEGICEVLGFREDVHAIYSDSNIVCLPSYREGLPKSLIEAAATGRAIVTTDVPGCRDVVIHEKTGLLVPVKDDMSLANALQYLIENAPKRAAMGEASRQLAESTFSMPLVVKAHLDIYETLTRDPNSRA